MLTARVSLSFSLSTCCRFACDWGEQRHLSDGPRLFLPWFKKGTKRIELKNLLLLLTPFFHWNSTLLISSTTIKFWLVYKSQIPSAFEPLYTQKEESGKKTNMPSKPVQMQDLPVSERTLLFPLGFLAGNTISIVIWIDSELLPALPMLRQNLQKLHWGQKDPHSQNDCKTPAVLD